MTGGDIGMGGIGSRGGGGCSGFENFILYDPSNAESVKATRTCNIDAGHTAAEVAVGGLNAFYAEKEKAQVELAEVAHPAIFRYQRKIKEALDPHEVGDGSWLYLDEHEIEAGSKRAKTALPPV